MKRSDEIRKEAAESRKRLVGTVGELGTALSDAKAEAIAKAKRAAPIAASATAGLVLLKLLGRRRS